MSGTWLFIVLLGVAIASWYAGSALRGKGRLMNHFGFLFLSLLTVMVISWSALVLVPKVRLGNLKPAEAKSIGAVYPSPIPGDAHQGAELYRSLGCVQCHTQQVRDAAVGSDVSRGWGKRRTVAVDYVYQDPAFLGDVRLGPDLANYGARTLPEGTEASAREEIIHQELIHLFNPRITQPGSIMPPHPFLFRVKPIGVNHSPDALNVPNEFLPRPGYEVVPKEEAKILVSYLMSLRMGEVSLDYAPVIPSAEESEVAVAGNTN